MNRVEALEYLERKGKLNKKLQAELDKLRKDEEYEDDDQVFGEKDAKEVMKKGKIYGDPVVELG
jgi:hypothetical protein